MDRPYRHHSGNLRGSALGLGGTLLIEAPEADALPLDASIPHHMDPVLEEQPAGRRTLSEHLAQKITSQPEARTAAPEGRLEWRASGITEVRSSVYELEEAAP